MDKTQDEKKEIFKTLKQNLALTTAERLNGVSKNDSTSDKKKFLFKRNPDFQPIPLYETRVSAGLPSKVEDNIQHYLDLHTHLVHNPNTTFSVTVEGNSMLGAGIYEDDILVVDAQKKPKNNDIVVASIYGELTIKRLKIFHTKLLLVPENPQFKPIEITESMDFRILGVVLHVIHSL